MKEIRILVHNVNNMLHAKGILLEMLKRKNASKRNDPTYANSPDEWVASTTMHFLESSINEMNSIKADVEAIERAIDQ